MHQRGSSALIVIVILALLVVGGYFFLGSKGTPAPTSEKPVASGTAENQPVAPAPVASNPDDIVAAIAASADAESSASDPSADAALVGNDADIINAYGDAYDPSSF